MNQVPGSLTGEVLCEEIINQISQVKTVKNNAASAISEALLSSSDDDTHEDQLEDYYKQLKQAADAIDFEKDQLRALIQEKQEQRQQASDLTPRIDKETVIPKLPHYFKITTIEGIDHSTRTIHLTNAPSNVPISICGYNCTTNLKACQLVAERYGIQSPCSIMFFPCCQWNSKVHYNLSYHE